MSEFESLPSDARCRLAEVCDHFEAALRRGEPVRTEHYSRICGPGERILLRELLLLECEYRRRDGDPVTNAELAARFPEDPELVAEVMDLASLYSGGKDAGGLLLPDGSPAVVGRYRLLRELGRGGFGTVFLAADIESGREVALKIPHAAVLLTPGLRLWFLRETQVAAALHHPNIVRVIGTGDVGLVCYLATEFVPGPSLADWLAQQDGPMKPALAAGLVRVLAGAVQHAHAQGILHRDLKPANVLLENGDARTPKLTDFGLARLADAPDLCHTDLLVGTPAYMAPEQAAGRQCDVSERTDVYALGAILYESLTRRPPFSGRTFVEIYGSVLSDTTTRPRSLDRGIPQDLETICLKCLEKEPTKRYATAAALADDLERHLSGRAIKARPVGPVGRLWRWCRREPTVAILGTALFLILLGAIAGLTHLWLRAEHQANVSETVRNRAEENYELTRQVAADLMWATRVAPVPTSTGRIVQLDSLTRAETAYKKLLQSDPTNSALRANLAGVYLNLGANYWIWDRLDLAMENLVESQRHWELLSPDASNLRENRLGLAQTLITVSRVYQRRNQLDVAIVALKDAIALHRNLVTDYPESTTVALFVQTVDTLASLLSQAGKPSEACALLDETVNIISPMTPAETTNKENLRLLMISTFLSSGNHFRLQNKSLDALNRWHQAYDLWTVRTQELPGSHYVEVGSKLVEHGNLVAGSLRFNNFLAQAEEVADRSRQVCDFLVTDSPKCADCWALYSDTWTQIAKNAWQRPRLDKTLSALRQAIKMQKAAVGLNPSAYRHQQTLAERYIRLGRCFRDRGQFTEAEECFLTPRRLCPNDVELLTKSANEMKILAAEVVRKAAPSPADSSHSRRCLALADELIRAAALVNQPEKVSRIE